MIKEWARQRSLERIGLVGGSSLDHESLRAAVLAEVAKIVPFGAFVWLLCDPATTVGIAPRARIPCPEELPLLIRLKYASAPARWTELMRHRSRASSLLSATQNDPGQSLVWSGVLRRYGISDVLSAVLADKHGCWGWLDLWRMEGQPAFSSEELAYLADAVTETTPGLRRSVARQFDPGSPAGALPQQAVLTLDEDLAVAGETASTSEWLQLLQPGPPPYQRVPAEVLNVAAQLLAVEAGADSHRAEARVHLRSGDWAMVRATRMAAGSPGATPPLAVTIQECPPRARLDLFARSFGLTPRQTELLELAAAGSDTAAMARAQGTAKYTVQDQFKHIFEQCGVHSRAALLAKALGSRVPLL